MSVARTITHAKGGDWQGHQGLVAGLGHSANDRSMSIRDKGDGDIILHSFAGDDWRLFKDALRAEGHLPARNNQKTPGDGIHRYYVYQNADGSDAFRMVRTMRGDRKFFHAEHADGRGGWCRGTNGTHPLLYRLPELLASHRDETVYIVEGEKDADNLAALGLIATTNPNGAGKWRDSFAEHLTGRVCVILPDNDVPGRDHAGKVSCSLRAADVNHVVLVLPSLPDKGDVSDWLANGGDALKLAALAASAWDAQPPTSTLVMIDPSAWQSVETPLRAWALAHWIPARQATYLTGAGGAGKSLVAQQLCTSVALGLPFMGVETRQSVAIYLTCEDDTDELHRRQKTICAALGVTLSALCDKLHLVSLAGVIGNELATFDPLGRMSTADRYAELKATVQATKAGFVALDNVAHLFAGNENIRNQVAAFCGLLNNLAADSNAAILFIGHPNKAGDNFSGSTAWENQVRSRLFLEIPRDTNGTSIDPDARTLTRAKANYARNGESLAFRWHQWAFVRNEDLPADHRAQVATNILAASENERFLYCLKVATERRRAVSHHKGSNWACTTFARFPEARGMLAAGFERAFERLLSIGKIRINECLWKGDDRHWKYGIKLASECGNPPAVSRCGDLRDATAEVVEKDSGTLRAGTPLYPTGKSGAAFEACAPNAPDLDARVQGNSHDR